MKEFLWDYFTKSGDISAYLAYKRFERFENGDDLIDIQGQRNSFEGNTRRRV